jgi:hypothetical protein
MRMHITLKIILIISSKWLESTLKRNQFMNELFIKSFINDIYWRNIKEENSWSYTWRFYHKRLMMVKESSITIQDMIWENRNQSNEFWTLRKVSHVPTKNILVIQSEEDILVYYFKNYKHIYFFFTLLSTNDFLWEMFHWKKALKNALKLAIE